MRERKKAGKKEREITVLTLLVEALSHMSQSHSLTLSPFLESSSSHPFINYNEDPEKKQKTTTSYRYRKRTVSFFLQI